VAVLVVAAGLALAASLALDRSRARQAALRQEHLAGLAQEYQGYLDETAQKIDRVPVDPQVVGEIQTRHYQERPGLWLYVWASGNEGEFLFGVPADAFARLNNVYEHNQEVLERDNHFATRDQFLRALLHHGRRLGPLPPVEGEDERSPGERGDGDWWRFYREEDDSSFQVRDRLVFLSSPIRDQSGATAGNLHLKLVDTRDLAAYSSAESGRLEDLTAASMAGVALSLLWLWFLLPSWVYIDARDRNMPRPLLWALLTLVGNVVALLVYLISRPENGRDLTCPRCARTLDGTRPGCPYCGADVSAVFCTQCQYPIKPDWSFCPSCRTAIGRPASLTEPSPPSA
jgi:hypothetical protein